MKPKFKLSPNVAVQTQDITSAREFYSNILKFSIKNDTGTEVEFKSGDSCFYVMESKKNNTVLEFFVNDLETAKNHLLENGCKIIKWKGKGKDCYMEDPFGVVFNLWEE
jgi:predicted enzyme related to lactoylglutathione lyase